MLAATIDSHCSDADVGVGGRASVIGVIFPEDNPPAVRAPRDLQAPIQRVGGSVWYRRQ